MSYLLIGDLHLTDRPRDAYRFGILEWARKQQVKYKPQATFILGDVTDSKDRHSSVLVNKFINGLCKLEPPVYILMGNHDYTDPTNPFFKFLNNWDGITFVINPTEIIDDRVAMIPHCRTQDEFNAECRELVRKPDLLLLHNTFSGAIAETGAPLTGFSPSAIEYLKPKLGCYAGDVHRPQRAGPVVYVGAPYHVRFGDDFEPRCLLIEDDGTATNLCFEAPRKWRLVVRSADEILSNDHLLEGDQVKVTVELAREESVDWKTYKQQVLAACKKMGVEVFGVDLRVNTVTKHKGTKVTASHQPSDTVIAFCKAEGASTQVREAGLSILKD
jgi:hypothetical protein